MSEESKTLKEFPRGAIHLGTFTVTGSGIFVSGVAKLSSDPERDLLEAADSFLKAADRCLTGCELKPGLEMLTVPGAVCAAFACELFLKYVRVRESGEWLRGHDLSELFNKLDEQTRVKLIEARTDIEQVLRRNRDHFKAARYHHELAEFSFRQQELLQLAQLLSRYVQEAHKTQP